MLVLHGIWINSIPGKLHFWAETSHLAASPSLPRSVRGRPKGPSGQATAKTRAHPFALAGSGLLEAVSSVAGSLLAEGGRFEALDLHLPSTAQTPLPSPQLFLDALSVEKADGLAPWQVPTLAFEPPLALDALLGLTAQPPSLVFGESLDYWLEVAHFGLELTARQSFVPVVYEPSPIASAQNSSSSPKNKARADLAASYRAGWQSHLEQADKERLKGLARAMPPLCRAVIAPSEREGATTPAHPFQLVNSFVDDAVDGFVRQSLLRTPLLPRRLRKSNLSLAEQWLHALSSPDDPTLAASEGELKTFAADIGQWLEQLQGLDTHAPFRTCFRLDPPRTDPNDPRNSDEADDGADWLDDNLTASPEANADRWRLGFFLQATDDPTLLVEAAQVWQERSGTLKLLQRRFDQPQERLLADLGRASRLYPPLEESLKTARPNELNLDTDGAYQFLRFVAPLLEQSGFGVLLPGWWSKPALRLGAKMRLRPPQPTDKSKVASAGLLGLESLVQYDWQVALGDQVLSPKEFEKLANLKVGLVRVRGQWVELKPEQLEAALAFFKKQHLQGQMSLGEALQLGLDPGEQTAGAVGLPVTEVETEGWVKELLDRLTHLEKMAPIAPPAGLQGQLRPYQLQGVSWLAFLRRFGFGACLADDMGLGKTIQLIALLLHERERGEQGLTAPEKDETPENYSLLMRPGPTLLVCPMSVVGNWQRELARFAPSLKVMVHHGADRLTGDEFETAARSHEVVLTTYALAQRDEAELARIEWQNLVLDEAQNIKNALAKQTAAIRRIPAHSRIALTGTPVENRLSELWSIMHFLNPGYLGSAQEFRARFATPIEKYHEPAPALRLKNLIQPFVLRRLKTDKSIIADLPDKLEMKVFCNLTREQATLYEAVVKDMLEQIEQAESIQRRGLILSALMKLKQICNHPAQFAKDSSSLPGRSGKLARLEEMLEEVLAEGDRALIFSQFAEMGGMLRSYLQERLGREVLFLHGGTPKSQRDLMVQRFGGTGRNVPPLFILSLKAGGVGLNLTAANHVFHFDRWWNPAVENQATDRAFRIGQQKNVQVHKFVCVGTLEERIDAMIEQKKELAQAVVGSGEGWLTELSTAQLRDLFALGRDAVGE